MCIRDRPEFNQKSSENASALIITTFETKISGFNREQVPDNELGDMWGAYDLGCLLYTSNGSRRELKLPWPLAEESISIFWKNLPAIPNL